MDVFVDAIIGPLSVTGSLHLNAVQNAKGTTLHANLSNTKAVDQTTGDRYRGTGSEKTTVPTGPGEINWSPTFTFVSPNTVFNVANITKVVFNLVITLDSAGEIQSARLASLSEALPRP
ncbi:MAG: hypothetical protein WD627_08200 [Actinomycetota bacterium]